MRRWVCFIAVVLASSLFGGEQAKRVNHFFLGAGGFNMLRDHRQWQFQMEYRWDYHFYNLRPLFAFMGTHKGSFYACGGVAWDIFLGKHAVLTPSFAPGVYMPGGGKDLHFPIEFRSAIELAYVFKDKARLGAQFYHISNASLARKNPGAESLIFFYAFPIFR